MTARALRLAVRQREAMLAVQAGRVSYGDPFPQMAARRAARLAGTQTTDMVGRARTMPTDPAAYMRPVFLLDGNEVYGGQHATYSSLSRRGLIASEGYDAVRTGPDEATVRVVLTDAGRAALDPTDEGGTS